MAFELYLNVTGCNKYLKGHFAGTRKLYDVRGLAPTNRHFQLRLLFRKKIDLIQAEQIKMD